MFGIILLEVSYTGLFGKASYLDPGSGSFILQLILATLLGGLLILRSYWTKVKDFFVGLFNRDSGEDEQDG